MKLLTLLLALTALYYVPKPPLSGIATIVRSYLNTLNHYFNGGKASHALFIWLLGVLVPALLTGLLGLYLHQTHALLGLIFGFLILYFTLDFSNFGVKPKKIADALSQQNLPDAEAEYNRWQAIRSTEQPSNNANQIASNSIAALFKSAHYGLLALIFWFFILGAAGVILFALSVRLASKHTHEPESAFERMTAKILALLDWLPSYLTATCFAVVGDFEDAVYCWRTQIDDCKNKTYAAIVASGAGALEVKLDLTALHPTNGLSQELGIGELADADYLKSAVGLVWRGLILLLGSFFLLTFAHFLGS